MSFRTDSAMWQGAPTSYARTYRAGLCTVVEIRGEIDMCGTLDIGPSLDAATGGPDPAVVIDLTAVTFLDCAGLALLCRAHRRMRERGGLLRLVCPDTRVLRTLRACGAVELLRPVPTLAAALGPAVEDPAVADGGALAVAADGRMVAATAEEMPLPHLLG